MATEVTIPNLGYTMTVAKILNWKKSVGDPIEFEEPLLEIETDKVTYLIEAPTSGVVKAVLVNVGDEVPVGGVVAIIGAADEQVEVSLPQKEAVEELVSELLRAHIQPVDLSQPIGHRLDPYVGMWTKEEAEEFDRILFTEIRRIDPELWE